MKKLRKGGRKGEKTPKKTHLYKNELDHFFTHVLNNYTTGNYDIATCSYDASFKETGLYCLILDSLNQQSAEKNIFEGSNPEIKKWLKDEIDQILEEEGGKLP